jgi:hypothetical protein
VLCHLPNCDLTSWLVKDACSYGAPAARKAGTNGESHQCGKRLAIPLITLENYCRHVTLDIYGRREKTAG